MDLQAKSKALIVSILLKNASNFINCYGGMSLKIENTLKNEKERNLFKRNFNAMAGGVSDEA